MNLTDIHNQLESRKDSTMTLKSIFMFKDEPTMIPAFLHVAEKNNVTVVFENENEVFNPKGDAVDPIMMLSWITYLTMNKRYIRNYMDFLAGDEAT